MTVDIYGIPNCDTMRKARKWLAESGVEYTFHNYKKEGVELALLQSAAQMLGWEKLLNRRGTSWRRLDEEARADVDCAKALQFMQANPSLIKRPLLLIDDIPVALGFDAEKYHALMA